MSEILQDDGRAFFFEGDSIVPESLTSSVDVFVDEGDGMIFREGTTEVIGNEGSNSTKTDNMKSHITGASKGQPLELSADRNFGIILLS